MPREEALDPADYDMVGVLGKLSMPIRAGGTGELIYSQDGTRRVAGARSEDGAPIAKGAEVVVTRYEKGIAYVRPWEELDGRRWSNGAVVERSQSMDNQVFVIAGADGAGDPVPDDDVRQAVPQGGAARGAHRLRLPRHARRQGPRHGDLPDGRKLPRAVAGADVVRRRAEAGPLHEAGRRGHGRSGRADQGEVAIRSRS